MLVYECLNKHTCSCVCFNSQTYSLVKLCKSRVTLLKTKTFLQYNMPKWKRKLTLLPQWIKSLYL